MSEDRPDTKINPAPLRLRWLHAASWMVLCAERLAVAFWPAAAWGIFFAALWLFDLPAALGDAAEGTAVILYAIGSLVLIYIGVRDFRLPGRAEIQRRLEQSSGLAHRPLSAWDDRLAAGGTAPGTLSLWQEYKASLARTLRKLKFPRMQPVVANRDPYALRLGAAILLVAGITVAGASWQERLRDGLTPFDLKLPGAGEKDSASITIVPPAYTRRGEIVAQSTIPGEPVGIPEGSVIRARVTGGIGAPRLIMGENSLDMERLAPGAWALETDAAGEGIMEIRQALGARVQLSYALTPDTPPTVEVSGTPEDLVPRHELRFPLTLADDYGVRDLTMKMDLDPAVTERPLGEPFEETRAVMSAPGQDTSIQPVYDLTGHPWAGLPVVITFAGTDDLGQSGTAASVAITLPEREFSHPVAKILVEQRKRLSWGPVAAAPEAVQALEFLLREPGGYQNDIVVHLALRTAASRLRYAPGEETARALQNLLWDTAVHLEDGDISMAMRRLTDAQRNLEQALDDPGATDEELAALTQKLREALAEYFRELGRALQKRAAEGQPPNMLPPDILGNMISPEDFQEFFDRLESESLSGDKDAARELLSQLGRMMEMLNPGFSAPMPQDLQMMAKGMNEIQELIGKQQDLLDLTREKSALMTLEQTYGELLPTPETQDGDMPPPPQATRRGDAPPVSTKTEQASQESLRFVLGQLMREAGEALDEIPPGMGLAEQEMRGSAARLGEDLPDASVPHQEQAIEYLRQAMQSLSQQMMAKLEQMTGMSIGQAPTDPLGRRYGDQQGPDWLYGSKVKIPDEAQRKKVEEILKILRRRSGELNRPEEERDYYRRLLQQF